MRPRPPWHAPLSRRLGRIRSGVPTLAICATVCAGALASGYLGPHLAQSASQVATVTRVADIGSIAATAPRTADSLNASAAAATNRFVADRATLANDHGDHDHGGRSFGPR